MSINVGNLNKALFESGEDGQLTRAGLAEKGVRLSKDGKQDEARLAGLFSIGGKDGKGLFPDFNHDKLITAAELRQLAEKSGKKDVIEESDLQKAFPKQFKPRESVDPKKLNKLADDEAGGCINVGGPIVCEEGDHMVEIPEEPPKKPTPGARLHVIN